MSRVRSTLTVAFGIGMAGLVTSKAQHSPLQSVVQSSTAVVAGYIENVSFDGSVYRFELRVVRSLKGTLSPGTAVAADFAPTGPKKLAIPSKAPQGAVLVAMDQDGQGLWHLSALGPPSVGLSAGYFRIPDQVLDSTSSVSGTLEARVAQVMAAAIEADTSQAARFLGFVRYSDAPNVFDSWSGSNSPHLRAYGLGARIAAQDASAVGSLASAIAAADRTDASLIGSALRGYRNPAPNAVIAIGTLAMTPGVDPPLIVDCAYALSAIHTKQSVPFLAGLLDSRDPMVRQLAVAGLSSFVTNMRIAKDGLDSVEARDEVLNPGRRRSLPSNDAPFETMETRAFLHFGPFKSDADEASVISFWKNWYQQNRAAF